MARFASSTAYHGKKASNNLTGQSRIAKSAEISAGTADDLSVSPSGLSGFFGAPSAIGGTTPAAGTFTTLTADSFQLDGGAVTDSIGQATLVSGTVTVANTSIAATDKVFVTREGVASSTALGVLDVSITASTSFTITALQPGTPGSTQTGDLSIVNYFIVRQV